jgi:hypothetical protein
VFFLDCERQNKRMRSRGILSVSVSAHARGIDYVDRYLR